MGDMRGGGIHPSYSYMYRWPDSDLPGRQHRQYEIAGAALGMDWDMAVCPCAEDLEKCGEEGKVYPLDHQEGEVPFHYVTGVQTCALPISSEEMDQRRYPCS